MELNLLKVLSFFLLSFSIGGVFSLLIIKKNLLKSRNINSSIPITESCEKKERKITEGNFISGFLTGLALGISISQLILIL